MRLITDDDITNDFLEELADEIENSTRWMDQFHERKEEILEILKDNLLKVDKQATS